MTAIEKKLFEQIRKLDAEQKKQVLNFAHGLTHPKGEPLGDIIQHASQLGFSREDLEEVKEFIDKDFASIDWGDWTHPPTIAS